MNLQNAELCYSDRETGMAGAVLAEIQERLQDLVESGTESAIDLRGLPLTSADILALEQKLGIGEVSATLEVAGTSRVWETAYHGVWWIRHLGRDGKVAAEQIAITGMPEILKSHPQDILDSATRLRRELSSSDGCGSNQEAAND